MHWVYLLLSGFFEVAFTSALVRAQRASTGGEAAMWYGAFGVALAFGMGFFILASRMIPMGTAYAIFAGLGAVGTLLMGIFVFQESAGFWRLFFLSTLIISIIGIELVGN